MTDAPVTAATPSADLAGRLRAVEGVLNLRHVGGYPTAAGPTRPDLLYRSAALDMVADPAALHALGIATIVDLRGDGERTTSPSVGLGDGVTTFHVPIFDPARPFDDVRDLADLYRRMVDGCGATLGRAASLVAEHADRPVLVHCTGGKDRTGLVIGLVLALVGVSDDDIDADYAHSAALIAPLVEARLTGSDVALAATTGPGGAAALVGPAFYDSPAGLLRETLAYVRERHGSVERFATAVGMGEATIGLLRSRLVTG